MNFSSANSVNKYSDVIISLIILVNSRFIEISGSQNIKKEP